MDMMKEAKLKAIRGLMKKMGGNIREEIEFDEDNKGLDQDVMVDKPKIHVEVSKGFVDPDSMKDMDEDMENDISDGEKAAIQMAGDPFGADQKKELMEQLREFMQDKGKITSDKAAAQVVFKAKGMPSKMTANGGAPDVPVKKAGRPKKMRME